MLWLAANAAFAAESELPLAVPVDEPAFHAQLTIVDATWKLQFAPATGPAKTQSAATLVKWGTWSEAALGPRIVLMDGSVIICPPQFDTPRPIALAKEGEQDFVLGASENLEHFKVPLPSVAGIIFDPPANGLDCDRLTQTVLAGHADSDLLLLINGDQLPGALEKLAGDDLSWKTSAGPAAIEVRRVRAVLFNSTLQDKPAPRGLTAIVGLSDGSRVRANSLIGNSTKFTAVLTGGGELHFAGEALVALQPVGGDVTYLSDLKAASYKHVPYLDLPWPYHGDLNARGGQLRVRGQTFVKGLGMHSASRLTYNLDSAYRRFDASLAIDELATGRGSVIFRLYIDTGDGRWEPRFTSAVIRGDMPPTLISVDLAGAKRIGLLVEFADRGDELDYADWLDARLVK